MNTLEIEDKLKKVLEESAHSDFIFSLLAVYDFPKSTIAKLKKDPYKTSGKENLILLKNKFAFKSLEHDEENKNKIYSEIEILSKDTSLNKFTPRFIIATDFKTVLVKDTSPKVTDNTLDCKFEDLYKNYAFFLPWIGMEKAIYVAENPADIKASYKMAKLYDQTISDNPKYAKENLHDLNIFLSRLLFCFFAEDTNIFKNDIFTYFIKSYTKEDGSDLAINLDKLFEVLNTKERQSYPAHFKDFPYVNGDLFGKKISLPNFTKKSRDMIVECADLNWAEINPDIFGSMIQAVVHPDQRENLGMHYTSVPNIMKVIEPLFLNELNEEFYKNYDDVKKLERLWKRLGEINIFDPACGSGNFLIISFIEMCRLEMKILDRIRDINNKDARVFDYMDLSIIKLSQFYGIEIDDFAHEMAILSLWLAQHQMNNKFKDLFGESNPTLPLKEGGKIVCGNSTREDWEKVCPKVDEQGNTKEIYIAGNPPYLGFLQQQKSQKEDMDFIFNFNGYKKLDYISCWFYKGSQYINNSEKIKLAFVSTNSISQGEQVSLLWPEIFKLDIEIIFAYQSFKWQNLAKGNAGVTCVIIGLGMASNCKKYIYINERKHESSNVNAYLVDSPNIFVTKRLQPLSNLPEMDLGSSAYDGGFLMLTSQEKDLFINNSKESSFYIKQFMGSAEFIRGIKRYCIWITDSSFKDAIKILDINKRLEKVKMFRSSSNRDNTSEMADSPYKFTEIRHKEFPAIIIPIISSDLREYIPIGFIDKSIVVPNSARVIYNPEPWIFGIITSRMHMVWVRAVAGRLKTDLRYSSSLCYNTFLLPNLTDKQKEHITHNVINILGEREKHSEKTIAELYDREKMPEGLRQAHKYMDELIDKIYREKKFENDKERLSHLFKLYEEMINRGKLIKDESILTKKKKQGPRIKITKTKI